MTDASEKLPDDLRLRRLEESMLAVEERNRRVELEKSWESSTTRLLTIALLTYFVMCLLFVALEADRPFAHAVVPAMGFILSTWTVPVVRGWWVRRRR